jgi:hypothetical protein
MVEKFGNAQLIHGLQNYFCVALWFRILFVLQLAWLVVHLTSHFAGAAADAFE